MWTKAPRMFRDHRRDDTVDTGYLSTKRNYGRTRRTDHPVHQVETRVSGAVARRFANMKKIVLILCGVACAAAASPAFANSRQNDGRPTDPRTCLILALYHEAGYETVKTIEKHAYTIVWRVRRDDYPNTICKVIFQKGAFQPFHNGVPPMKDAKIRAKVARVADRVLAKAFPDSFGGAKCVERDLHTGTCIARRADLMPAIMPVATHFAVADCYFVGKSGYDYVRNKRGECVPRWSLRMVRVTDAPCSLISGRPCRIVFWRPR